MNELEAVAAEIKAVGGEALPVQSHLGRMEEINRMVTTAMGISAGSISWSIMRAPARPWERFWTPTSGSGTLS